MHLQGHNETDRMVRVKRRLASDLLGKRFGRLVVLGLSARKTNDNRSLWLCLCDCGVSKEVRQNNLLSGNSTSCGCFHNEELVARTYQHGHARVGNRSGIYGRWQQMVARCTIPSNTCWEKYGGRGIKVCERWRNSFADFLADMGEPPTQKHSIDRINNNGNYEPENCRWATSKQQARNRSDNYIINFKGQSLCISDWAEQAKIKLGTLRSRLKSGWPMSKAIVKGGIHAR